MRSDQRPRLQGRMVTWAGCFCAPLATLRGWIDALSCGFWRGCRWPYVRSESVFTLIEWSVSATRRVLVLNEAEGKAEGMFARCILHVR